MTMQQTLILQFSPNGMITFQGIDQSEHMVFGNQNSLIAARRERDEWTFAT
jgi:hypothetical protein